VAFKDFTQRAAQLLHPQRLDLDEPVEQAGDVHLVGVVAGVGCSLRPTLSEIVYNFALGDPRREMSTKGDNNAPGRGADSGITE
jgi:hypothetical protein